MDVLQPSRVTSAFQKDEFKIDVLQGLRQELQASVERQESAARAERTVASVCGDWGMFSPETIAQCGDKDVPAYRVKLDAALKALNAAGKNLFDAIKNYSIPEIKACFESIRAIQSQYSDCGASDTEGRTAIWYLISWACEGTTTNPDDLWDRYC